jgi:hypothetical protein
VTSTRVCPWCEVAALVIIDGYSTCPDCHVYLVSKGGLGFDEAYGARIMMDSYWRMCPPPTEERLISIDNVQKESTIKP